MTRLIQLLSLSSLIILFIGCLIMPAMPLFWLASSSLKLMIIRFLFIALLGIIVFMGTPKNMTIRTIIGLFASLLAIWALSSTYNESIQALDGLAFASVGIALLLSSLEPAEESQINWNGAISLIAPLTVPLQRRAAVYMVVMFMAIGLIGQDYQVSLIKQALQ